LVRYLTDDVQRRTQKYHSPVVEVSDEDSAVTKRRQVTREVQLIGVTASRSAVAGQQCSVCTDDTDSVDMITLRPVADHVPADAQRYTGSFHQAATVCQ